MAFISFTMSDLSKAYGSMRILCEALKLPSKNKGLMLFILLSSLLSSFILFFTNHFSVSPLLMDLFINLYVMGNTNPNSHIHTNLLISTKNVLTNLTISGSVLVVTSFIISSALLTATVHASAMAHLNRHLTIEELYSRMRRSWRGPIITQLCVAVLSLGCVLILSSLFSLLVLISENWVVLAALRVVLGLVSLYLFLRLTSIWLMALVISVVEDGCYGVEALAREMRLDEGIKRQGVMILFLMMAATWGMYEAYCYAFVPRLAVNSLTNGIFTTNLGVMMSLITVSAYTVLYCDCKKSRAADARGDFVCMSSPQPSHADGDFP